MWLIFLFLVVSYSIVESDRIFIHIMIAYDTQKPLTPAERHQRHSDDQWCKNHLNTWFTTSTPGMCSRVVLMLTFCSCQDSATYYWRMGSNPPPQINVSQAFRLVHFSARSHQSEDKSHRILSIRVQILSPATMEKPVRRKTPVSSIAIQHNANP